MIEAIIGIALGLRYGNRDGSHSDLKVRMLLEKLLTCLLDSGAGIDGVINEQEQGGV